MSGRLSIAARSAPAETDSMQCASQFRGLMALLAAIELADVDLGVAETMHSSQAKNFNIGKARAALQTGLRDFKRGNAVMLARGALRQTQGDRL